MWRKSLDTNEIADIYKHAIITQAAQVTYPVIRSIEDGNDVDTIYLDLAKAFDKVDHFLLASKLKNMSIGGKVGMWIYNSLTNRIQQIATNSASSPLPSPIRSSPGNRPRPNPLCHHDQRH